MNEGGTANTAGLGMRLYFEWCKYLLQITVSFGGGGYQSSSLHPSHQAPKVILKIEHAIYMYNCPPHNSSHLQVLSPVTWAIWHTFLTKEGPSLDKIMGLTLPRTTSYMTASPLVEDGSSRMVVAPCEVCIWTQVGLEKKQSRHTTEHMVRYILLWSCTTYGTASLVFACGTNLHFFITICGERSTQRFNQ